MIRPIVTRRVYLAGPDVFDPDQARIFAERREICRRYALEAIVPIDGQADTAASIYRSNVALLSGADGVIANITPFRGPHCDVGTAWEIGHAVARALPVVAFSATDAPLAARATRTMTLGTGVNVPGLRQAPAVANGIATINRLAPGRCIIGLGTGHTGVRMLGQRPMKLAPFREYLRVVRGLLRGEDVE